MALPESPSFADALALAWAKGADAMDEYHEKRNHWLTWEGVHRGEPARPANPYWQGD